jgi:hypothetical protein
MANPVVPFNSPFIPNNVGLGNGEPYFRILGFPMNMA